MENKPERLERKLHVKTHPRAVVALKRVIVELSATDGIRFEGKAVTQEALTNAAWLMLEAWSPDRLEAELGPYLDRLNELVGHRRTAAEGNGENQEVTSATVARPNNSGGGR